MDYSNRWLLALRRIARGLRVLRPLASACRRFFNREYEEKFAQQMLSNIRRGDVVWDIGANVGFFTEEFAQRVGPAGKVVAFEPAPGSFAELMKNVRTPTVYLVNSALSNFDGEADFKISNITDPTNSLSASGGDSRGASEKVSVIKGDTYCLRNPTHFPSVVKVDVEGFEYEVLIGLSSALASPQLRVVCIEVHFASLEARKLFDVPKRIRSDLESHGFRVAWTDPSHIIATR